MPSRSETDLSLDRLRRDAKRLRAGVAGRAPEALSRVTVWLPAKADAPLRHADALHIIARENGFPGWAQLKLAAETLGLDRAARLQRLKVALYHGQNTVVAHLLDETPDLADGAFGLACALYDADAVETALRRDPTLAVQTFGPRRPILHLAFSRWIRHRRDLEDDMLRVAGLLVAHGADVNDHFAPAPGSPERYSALYGAVGHAGSMALARWLLDRGASPDDGESLYHATELGHAEGVRLLLEHGARPEGTNALLRAIDFHDHTAVALLLAHGAADDLDGRGAVAPPALHHAARRGCDGRMAALLLEAGADPAARWHGIAASTFARIVGNDAVAAAICARAPSVALTADEALLVAAAKGQDSPGRYLDPARLRPPCRDLLHDLVALGGRLDHIRLLVALGLEYDRADAQGIPPVQAAGWQGLAEETGYFLSLRPDLGHVNGHGGTLLTTILHGADNAPARPGQDHIACLRLALEQGAALPRQAIGFSGREDVVAFLTDWADRYPGQVVG